ncbi:hypothetical protein [Algoriphagus sediminis]|uniref:Uncharacterized protein n=1 Tax=Algoriphagus sediminis TaxID=3057113 RepID=A0ABT7YF33_9BACT|nr:hypothetical protein [Algoriphagus sediminis]MDN3204809.1 hypothetical protein [Algoriphagus sediminis]
MPFRKKFFLGLIICWVFFACNEDDPLPKDTSLVRIESLLFDFPPEDLNSRKLDLLSWTHVLENEIDINFRNMDSGEVYTILLDNGNFPSEEIALPFGSYEITGESPGGLVSETLPFYVNERRQIITEKTLLSLPAETKHGLFTLNRAEVKDQPKLSVSDSYTLFQTQEFYYFYCEFDQDYNLLLSPLESPVSFEYNWSSLPLEHHHLNLEREGEEPDLIRFETPSFTYNESVIDIDSEGFPTSLTYKKIADLGASQAENSGLAYFDGRLFSINDGGNSSEVFEINPKSGEVIRSITLANVSNIDWEDLAQSDSHLFIGDFGNNNGTRQDLRILSVPWEEILIKDETQAEVLPFKYENQSDFSGQNPNHDFDCEAFIYENGQFRLFTKNKSNRETYHYILEENSTNGVAIKIGSIDTKGQVTGASLNDQNELILIGYNLDGFESDTFIWETKTFSNDMLGKNGRRYSLGSPLNLGQNEGVIHTGPSSILISAEGINSGVLQLNPNLVKTKLPETN